MLNTEYWSFEPQRVVLGATPMIRGLTYGLQGARESDSLQLFVTSDLAYGSGNTGESCATKIHPPEPGGFGRM